jgi:hypothetical protein
MLADRAFGSFPGCVRRTSFVMSTIPVRHLLLHQDLVPGVVFLLDQAQASPGMTNSVDHALTARKDTFANPFA